MRRKIVAGNWKMNNNMSQTNSLIDSVIKKINFDTTYLHHSHF